MSIFNKNRMGLLSKKGLYKYILYGIGEIILVVIGILIAVSINDKNQERDAQKKLQSYLKIYHNDLVQDTTVVGKVLTEYVDKRKKTFKIFMSDTVSASTYKNHPEGYGIVLSYTPFKLQQKGISLLESYVNNNETQQDSLISIIVINHRAFDNAINESYKRIGEDIDSNMRYFKANQPWIADLLMGKVDNQNLINYYLSDTHRACLAIHSTLLFGNLEPQLRGFQQANKEILRLINERLEL